MTYKKKNKWNESLNQNKIIGSRIILLVKDNIGESTWAINALVALWKVVNLKGTMLNLSILSLSAPLISYVSHYVNIGP